MWIRTRLRVIGLGVVLAACAVVLNAQTSRVGTTARPAGATITPASAMNGAGAFGSVTTSAFNSFWNGSGAGIGLGNVFAINTAPTISSGFGTSPSVPSNNGTVAFTVNVGTGGTATSGVVGLATATTGWVCDCFDVTTQSATVFYCKQKAGTTTTATIANYNTAGAEAAWAASDIVRLKCMAY